MRWRSLAYDYVLLKLGDQTKNRNKSFYSPCRVWPGLSRRSVFLVPPAARYTHFVLVCNKTYIYTTPNATFNINFEDFYRILCECGNVYFEEKDQFSMRVKKKIVKSKKKWIIITDRVGVARVCYKRTFLWRYLQ